MYGHFDKQPHFTNWAEGLGPVTPVIKGDYLYGRGGADDGYAIFTCIEAIKVCQKYGQPHGDVKILIEGSEESGSIHLMEYIAQLEQRIGIPDLLVCMDSGCKDYDNLWITTSLRGVTMCDISVSCLKEAVHSGLGTGLVPDSFMVFRSLLDRVEDSKTGKISNEFHVDIPKNRIEEGKKVAEVKKRDLILPKLLDGVQPLHPDFTEIYLNSVWRPMLCVIGATGFPEHSTSGNVLRPSTSFRLSLRLPPTLDSNKAGEKLKEILVKDPPFNSKVEVNVKACGNGWNNRDLSEKVTGSLTKSAKAIFGTDPLYFGEGGSIPFINSLAQRSDKCDFLVMGVLGPNSNAHASNEALHIPYCKKVTVVLSHAISDFCAK